MNAVGSDSGLPKPKYLVEFKGFGSTISIMSKIGFETWKTHVASCIPSPPVSGLVIVCKINAW